MPILLLYYYVVIFAQLSRQFMDASPVMAARVWYGSQSQPVRTSVRPQSFSGVIKRLTVNYDTQ